MSHKEDIFTSTVLLQKILGVALNSGFYGVLPFRGIHNVDQIKSNMMTSNNVLHIIIIQASMCRYIVNMNEKNIYITHDFRYFHTCAVLIINLPSIVLDQYVIDYSSDIDLVKYLSWYWTFLCNIRIKYKNRINSNIKQGFFNNTF